MKKRIILLVLCFVMCAGAALPFAGCAVRSRSADLMASIDGEVPSGSIPENGNVALTEFAVDIFRESYKEGENTLVSPLSVASALGMVVNGAAGDTKLQMERVLGMEVSALNEYLYSYRKGLVNGEKYKLSLANGIWFRDSERFTVNEDFLGKNATYYDAGAYKAPFDSSTVRDINSFVNEHTDGMIKDIIKDIPSSAVMYLVNSLAFEAEWQAPYYKHQVRDGVFTTEAGEILGVDMMHSGEGTYIEDENATGFIKYYDGRKYAFAALLPREGMKVGEYIDTLTGNGVAEMLENAEYAAVQAAMPKFEFEFDTEMSGTLHDLGMYDAFAPDTADFSLMGSSTEGPLFISKVIHKTFISVGEKGTRAGAATLVEMADGAASPDEIKTVCLDRPFVFMIIDCEENVPLFIGALARANG